MKASLIEALRGLIWIFALPQTAAILLRKTAKLHANNADVVQKVNKKKRRSVGSLNRCAIQYEVSVCASHLPKHSHLVSATVDETFKLSEP